MSISFDNSFRRSDISAFLFKTVVNAVSGKTTKSFFNSIAFAISSKLFSCKVLYNLFPILNLDLYSFEAYKFLLLDIYKTPFWLNLKQIKVGKIALKLLIFLILLLR
jgi:hypothetical protein